MFFFFRIDRIETSLTTPTSQPIPSCPLHPPFSEASFEPFRTWLHEPSRLLPDLFSAGFIRLGRRTIIQAVDGAVGAFDANLPTPIAIVFYFSMDRASFPLKAPSTLLRATDISAAIR